MRIDRDTFDEWLAHPMTEAVFACFGVWGDEAKAAWVARSWEAGECDPLVLARLRERAKVFSELKALTAESIEESL